MFELIYMLNKSRLLSTMAEQVVDEEEHRARKRYADNELGEGKKHGEEQSEVEESRKKQKNNAGEDEEEEGDDEDSIWALWQRFLSDPTNTQHLKALR